MSSGPRSAPPDLPGFTADRWIGGGGFADVFLYTQHRPSRSVAVKILRSEHLSAQALEQFDAEADIMAEVSTHPYIVTIFSSGVSPDGRPYIVMEHYPRPNFGERAKGGTMDLSEVLRTGIQVSSAVETAHRAGIIHRDIKPANILTSAFDRPGLTDFGISGVQTDGAISEAVGITVPYTAPELLDEQSAGSVATDVYGLGATISALASGHSPFWVASGDNGKQAVLARALRGQRTRLTRPDVPNSLNNLLDQAMNPNADHRPQSALALAQALQQIEQDLRLQPTPIEVAPGPETTHRAEIDDPNDDERTRRSIQVVDPQPSIAPGARRPASAHGSPPARTRPSSPAVPIIAASTPASVTSFAPPLTTSPTPAAPTNPTAPETNMDAVPSPVARANPGPATRVPSTTSTPSWARATPDEDAETVARRRTLAPGEAPAGFRPPTPPVTGGPTEASGASGAPSPAASPYAPPARALDADSRAADSATREARDIPWKPIGAGIAAVVMLVIVVAVVIATTGRSSKAGPGNDATPAAPIQSIATAPENGPVITPSDLRLSTFTDAGGTATATLSWTPDSDRTVSERVEVLAFRANSTAAGTAPANFDTKTNGRLTVTLHLDDAGRCSTATVGSVSVPCTEGPPCLRVTGHALNRSTGNPVVVQYSANDGDKAILRTPALSVTAKDYSLACSMTFSEAG